MKPCGSKDNVNERFGPYKRKTGVGKIIGPEVLGKVRCRVKREDESPWAEVQRGPC